MKKCIALYSFFVLLSKLTWAQHNVLSVGNTNTLTIKSSTIFSADSLVLIPSSDFTISTNAIRETPVPVTGIPKNSIARVYYFNNSMTFSGTIQLYYQLSELNGNIEASLKYNDLSSGSIWLMAGTSVVNTASHFVQFAAVNRVFFGATAAEVTSALPIKLVSFTGSWETDHVSLNWIFDQSDESTIFSVESGTDQQNWENIAMLPAVTANGRFTYVFKDPDAQFSTRFYRLRIVEGSGITSYSPVIKMDKPSGANNIRIMGRYNAMSIYFIGEQPKGIRVINISGQTVWRDNSPRNEYELINVMPGIYFIQYELKSGLQVKQYQLRY